MTAGPSVRNATFELVLSYALTPWVRSSLGVSYVTHSRLAGDATEIFRNLHNSEAALRWSRQATNMSNHQHTRAVGLRLAVFATAASQARDLDQALDSDHQALNILARVTSTRARRYVRDIAAALAPWAGDLWVRDFIERLDRQFPPAASDAVI
ncbi:hypothetical protein AB0M95_37935 [Sphaerisporangium sp. NPDC051017]|uniref:hypothetical protein n=1 Tax=Sphaerisporangium sp. NPDC051017 TaxID=3154636 RepID=UPI00343A216A